MTAMAFYRNTDMDQNVSAALDAIDAQLRPALIAAIEGVNAVLAGSPTETETLHHYASFLHRLVEDIDGNKQRRSRIAKRRAA